MLIAAIDNAGAVPLSPELREPHEVERRRLSAGDVQELLWREHESRRSAVGEYARLGKGGQSARASYEMAVIRRYLDAGAAGI